MMGNRMREVKVMSLHGREDVVARITMASRHGVRTGAAPVATGPAGRARAG